MTCERVEEQLSALIDDDLDDRTETAVRQHLRVCPRCTETYADLQKLVSISRELPLMVPPDRLFPAIRREVRRAQPQPRIAPQRLGWVLIPALATVVLMFVFFPRRRETAPIPAPVTAPAIAEQTPTPEPPVLTPASQPATPVKRVRRAVTRTAVASPVLVSSPVRETEGLTIAATQAREIDVLASLREIQQALEEIEAALHRNPGNAQVARAYQLTYQKGVELRDHYLAGTR